MNRNAIYARMDSFLTRTLSGTVFSWRQILDLMIPGILDSLSIMFINTLIVALISKNGESSIAAVSLVGPITGLITCIFSGISAGGTIVVAQCMGKGDPRLLRAAIGMTVWLTVLVGIIVCLPFLLFPGTIVELLYPTAEKVVMDKARIYLSGCVWSILLFTAYTAFFAVLRGLGESKRCLVLSIIINVAYLVFSILFLNILKWDISGSVCALILARFLGAVSAAVALLYWHPPVRLRLRELFTYERQLMGDTMRVSIPLGFEQVCASLGNIVAEMYMINLGTTALAIHAVASSLLGILYAPAASISSLSVAVVGRCVGAEKYEEAYLYGKRCNQITRILVAVTAVLFFPLLSPLLGQYNPTPETRQMATLLLYSSVLPLLLFWPTSNTLPSTLRAMKDTVFPSVLSLAVLWLVSIALGYVLAIPMGMGLWGVWAAMWCSWAVRAIGFQLRFRKVQSAAPVHS